MKPKIIAHGAEAIIENIGKTINKNRISKSYRHPELDKKIIKQRTKRETKLISKTNKIINSPKLISSTDNQISMNFIDGKTLSKGLDKLSNYQKVCEQIGENLAKLHDSGIIHGDLTTSNMILEKETSKVFFIDFGLGFHSNRIEDKAVDLHLIKEALKANHPKISKIAFKKILEGYKKSENFQKVLTRLEKVESRGRYKSSKNKTLKN